MIKIEGHKVYYIYPTINTVINSFKTASAIKIIYIIFAPIDPLDFKGYRLCAVCVYNKSHEAY